MARKKIIMLLFLLSMCHYTRCDSTPASASCPAEPRCTCEFQDGSSVQSAGDQADSRTVGMAGAVGALSSMLLTGGGFALWRLVKGRSDASSSYDRPPSAASQGSWAERSVDKGPGTPRAKPGDPLFDPSRRGSTMSGTRPPTNIYRMGRVWTGKLQPR